MAQVWDTFLAGVRERLQVKHIRKVTDSGGEAILAVEDLVHDDHLVIYAVRACVCVIYRHTECM